MDSEPPSSRRTVPLLAFLTLLTVGAFAAPAIDGLLPAAYPPAGWYVFGFGLLTLLGALLLLVQTAVNTVDPTKKEDDAGIRLRGAPVLAGSRDLVVFERSCLVAGGMFRLVAAILGVAAGARLAGGGPWLGAVVATVAVLVLHVLVYEAGARYLGLAHGHRSLHLFGALCYWVSWPLRPLASVTRTGGSGGPDEPDDRATRTFRHRELSLLPHVEGVDRVIEEEAVDMIGSVRAFTEMTAGDVMTPRVEVEGLDISTDAAGVLDRLQQTNCSRVVVYRESLDQVEGILLAKEVLLHNRRNPFALLREPIFVDEGMRLPDLLARFRDERSHLAIVQDEFGGTSGIVTLHDLFEQIVGGHIEDSEDEEEFWLQRDDDDHARLSGRVEIWEVNEELDLDLDETIARTLGGFLMYRFGKLPQEGDTWTVDGGVFRVEEIEGTRISVLSFVRDAAAKESPAPVPVGEEQPSP